MSAKKSYTCSIMSRYAENGFTFYITYRECKIYRLDGSSFSYFSNYTQLPSWYVLIYSDVSYFCTNNLLMTVENR